MKKKKKKVFHSHKNDKQVICLETHSHKKKQSLSLNLAEVGDAGVHGLELRYELLEHVHLHLKQTLREEDVGGGGMNRKEKEE